MCVCWIQLLRLSAERPTIIDVICWHLSLKLSIKLNSWRICCNKLLKSGVEIMFWRYYSGFVGNVTSLKNLFKWGPRPFPSHWLGNRLGHFNLVGKIGFEVWWGLGFQFHRQLVGLLDPEGPYTYSYSFWISDGLWCGFRAVRFILLPRLLLGLLKWV